MPTLFHITAARWRWPAFAICVAALWACMIISMHAGMNPYSLWLDDQWVATLVKRASTAEIVNLLPPAPLGFLWLQKCAASLLGWDGWSAWPLQAVPILFAFLQIPLIGWIAWRASGSWSLGVLAAALLSGSRLLMVSGLRSKQYTLEGFIALLLIALALMCVRSESNSRKKWLLALIVAALVSLPFSFTSVAVGLVIVNVLTLHLLMLKSDARGISRAAASLLACAYNALALLWVWLIASRQANASMYEFWTEHYLPLDHANAIWTFATGPLWRFFASALPGTFRWLAIAAPLAIVMLSFRRSTRLIALALLLFFGGMLALSALRMYPVGGRRTDVFSYPITVLAITGTIWAISRHIKYLPQIALAAVAINLILFYPDRTVSYASQVGRAAVEALNERLTNDDGLLLSPQSSWALGCYGRWPVRLERVRDMPNGFIVHVDRPRTLSLRLSIAQAGIVANSALAARLDEFISEQMHRIYYLSIHPWPGHDDWVTQPLEARGFVERKTPLFDDRNRVRMFEKSGGASSQD